MSNKAYDILKIISMILPAFAALIVAVGKIWGIPYYAEISGTIAAVDTFLLAVLKVLSDKYFADKEIVLKEEK